jgi:CRISPR/Cas system-associated exonuclease Cas4 (RecB family)
MTDKPYITASEMADFVYCPRGWWLRIHGKISAKDAERMAEGTQGHENISDQLSLGDRLMQTAKFLIVVGLLGILGLVIYVIWGGGI